MDLFGDQIQQRREADRLALEESFQRIAGVVLGQRIAEKLGDDRIVTKQALDEILKFYHLRPVDVPEDVRSAQEQMDYCLRRYGLMRREIELEEKWYLDACGPILGFSRENGRPVALLPGRAGTYYYNDTAGQPVFVNRKNAASFETEAICFYRPLPLKKLGIPDLLKYMRSCIDIRDVFFVVFTSVAASAVGLLIPRITAIVTGSVLGSKNYNALCGATIFIFCVLLANQLIGAAGRLISERIRIKTSLSIESSMMMRLLSLPVSFFRQYSPGELQSRAESVRELCDMLQQILITMGLTAASSLLYMTQIFSLARALFLPSLMIVLVLLIFTFIQILARMRLIKKRREQAAHESGITHSIITGIQKIKLAGAEKRIFSRWLNVFAKGAELDYDPPLILKAGKLITLAINLFGTVILYYLAVKNGVDQASYYAFSAAYGTVMGAFSALSDVAVSAASIEPILQMAEPFLDAIPEVAENREIVTGISGNVELDHISFRYNERSPYILDDVSLKIRPGEYVAIVGRTGCGKSTLIRLLLGFETPEKGAVYYDGRDLNSLDTGSLRRHIGTVTQDGGLFQGDIFSNIVITAPHLGLDDAWEAAEKAGIADDIRNMPMGMFTVVSEGQGGISGGQKQRIMIARAIAPGPRLLIFDEATSALDNKTQKQVSDALDSMGCTRIVVAHRLSTIRHCDRIVVLDGGKIIEDGTYDELMEKKGFFAGLVERQMPG